MRPHRLQLSLLLPLSLLFEFNLFHLFSRNLTLSLGFFQLLWQSTRLSETCQQYANLAPASVPIQAPSTSAVEPLNEPVQSVTLVNIDNLSAARRSTSLVEEPTVFMARAKVQALLRREKEKDSTVTCLNLRPPYSTEIC